MGTKAWDYLEPNSVWKYENTEKQVFMVLEFDEIGAANLNCIICGKEGEWTLGIHPMEGLWKSMIL